MNRLLKSVLDNIIKDKLIINKDNLVTLISLLPNHMQENAVEILVCGTEEIYLGEVKCEKFKTSDDTNYITVDFNPLTKEYTVEYSEREEVYLHHNFKSEEIHLMKTECLTMIKSEVLAKFNSTDGKDYSYVKTNSWIKKDKIVSQIDWETKYKEII
jgi:hypothetical protein